MNNNPIYNYVFLAETHNQAVSLAKNYFSFEEASEMATVTLADFTVKIYFLSLENPFPRLVPSGIIDCVVFQSVSDENRQKQLFLKLQRLKWSCFEIQFGLKEESKEENWIFSFESDQVEKAKNILVTAIHQENLKLREAFNKYDSEGKNIISRSNADLLFKELGKEPLKHSKATNLMFFQVKALYFFREKDNYLAETNFAQEMETDDFGQTFKLFLRNLNLPLEEGIGSESKIYFGHEEPIEPKASLKGRISVGDSYKEVMNTLPSHFKEDCFVIGFKIKLEDNSALPALRALISELDSALADNDDLASILECGGSVGVYLHESYFHLEIKLSQFYNDIVTLFAKNTKNLSEVVVEDNFEVSTELDINDLNSLDLGSVLKKLAKFEYNFSGDNKHLSAVLGWISCIFSAFDLDSLQDLQMLDCFIQFFKVIDSVSTLNLNLKVDCNKIGETLGNAVSEEMSEFFEENREEMVGNLAQMKSYLIEELQETNTAINALNWDKLKVYVNCDYFKMNGELELTLPGMAEMVANMGK